jgi:uncharacterized protein involved in oxidation of intracellular sulfur
MSYLFILNNEPYDGSDKTWNALRLAKNLHEAGENVRIFLMNDSVDLARDVCIKPDTYDTDLVAMLKEMYYEGVELRVCGTCQARCGIYKNEPYFDMETKSTMKALREWVQDSGQTLTF